MDLEKWDTTTSWYHPTNTTIQIIIAIVLFECLYVLSSHSHADGKQRKVLEENYGKHDKVKVEKVKKLFVDLKLEEIFKTYEEESYKAIQVRKWQTKAYCMLCRQ